MAEISTANLLNTNFFSVAPVARQAGYGVFVSAEAQALALAADDAGRANAATAEGRERPPPRFVAFDSKGQLVDTQEQFRGRLIDETV
jgi:hypothetical protein